MLLESQILLLTAATIAFVHTILGPDHYLVFTIMGKARGWSLARTLRIAAFCGLGHVGASLALGGVGLLLGAQLSKLMAIEGARGNFASWALIAFGLVYFAWGLRKAGRGHKHSHVHVHEDVVHDHEHDHHSDHMHVHQKGAKASVTPWAIFVIFTLGPCEALIPLLMYPAAQQSASLVISVALVFGFVTLITMVGAVAATTIGLEKLRLPGAGRYAHAIAGASIVLCGGAISLLGL